MKIFYYYLLIDIMSPEIPSHCILYLPGFVSLLTADTEHCEALHVRREVDLRNKESLFSLLTLEVWLEQEEN